MTTDIDELTSAISPTLVLKWEAVLLNWTIAWAPLHLYSSKTQHLFLYPIMYLNLLLIQ